MFHSSRTDALARTHPISHGGLGGGIFPRPGDISLARSRALFRDELPEFSSRALDVMRRPLDDHVVTISRADGTLNLPADFPLLVAFNSRPCRGYGDPIHERTWTPATVTRYQEHNAGTLAERIDTPRGSRCHA